MLEQPWWDNFPGRYEHELNQLDAAGIEYEVDANYRSEYGRVRLRAWPEVEGRTIEVIATFPDFYPYLPFQVDAPTATDLQRHRSPLSGNLCLLANPTGDWRPSDTLADYLTIRLRDIIRINEQPVQRVEDVGALEALQGEPISQYHHTKPTSVVFVDGTWAVPQETGDFQIALREGWHPAQKHFQGAVAEIRNDSQAVVEKGISELLASFPKSYKGRWAWLEPAPRPAEPQDVLDAARKRVPSLESAPWHRLGDVQVRFTALAFSEEVRWRTAATGWLFAVETAPAKKKIRPSNITAHLVNAQRAGSADLQERIPSLQGLEQKTVAVFGLGCLGAESSLQFARGGVGGLRLVDFDTVESGTVVRWPRGMSAVGLPKCQVLESQIKQDYPFTNAKSWPWKLGQSPNDATNERELMAEVLGGVDLIYDATAELGLQYLLSEVANERGIPYVGVSGTQGGWGGVLVRVGRESSGCWSCAQRILEKGLSGGGLDVPPADPNGDVQPQGCLLPTFTGIAPDMWTLALQAVRISLDELCEWYNGPDWDVAVLRLRDDNGGTGLLEVDTADLQAQPECVDCAART